MVYILDYHHHTADMSIAAQMLRLIVPVLYWLTGLLLSQACPLCQAVEVCTKCVSLYR